MKEAFINSSDLEIFMELARRKKEVTAVLSAESSIPEIIEKFNCEPHVFQEIFSVVPIK